MLLLLGEKFFHRLKTNQIYNFGHEGADVAALYYHQQELGRGQLELVFK